MNLNSSVSEKVSGKCVEFEVQSDVYFEFL